MTGCVSVRLEELNKSEALRYMGCKDGAPDENIRALMDQCEKELLGAIKPAFVYRVFDIEDTEDGVEVLSTALTLRGKDISAHLKGCEKCLLMAATLSAGADRIIRRFEAVDMTRAVLADFLASAAVEQVCDKAEEEIRHQLSGYYYTWRFSPGYGDLPLEIQESFLTVLDARKRIGLNVTQDSILTPRKSVTAIIGLSKNKINKGRQGCAICNMRHTCAFRKRGDHCAV